MTYTQAQIDKANAVDVAGAEKAFGFAHRGTDKQLLVFEAPIDLLSFIELFPKNWQQHNYLSLGGVSGKALQQFLSERPDVERVFPLSGCRQSRRGCLQAAGCSAAGHRERDPNPALHEGLERCSGAPGRDSEPQLFQKYCSERAAEKRFR
mgnify:CR=1 FL=1